MRTRQIHRDFWISESVASVGYFERLLFQSLWGQADRAGMLALKSGRIRVEAFPHDDTLTNKDIENGINVLADAGLIKLGSIRNDVITCIYIPNFLKYQHIHPHEAASKLECNYITGNVAKCNPASTSTSTSALGSKSARPRDPHLEIYMKMPIKGGSHPIPVEKVTEWQERFDRINVEAVLNNIAAWAVEAPYAKKWTATGCFRAIVRWLSKENDKLPPVEDDDDDFPLLPGDEGYIEDHGRAPWA